MWFFLIILSTYLGRVEEDVLNLEEKISDYVVTVHYRNFGMTMTGTAISENRIVTVGYMTEGDPVHIEDQYGNIFGGRVKGRDPSTGIHLIEVDNKIEFPPIRNEVRSGQICYVYGNSFGSMGIVGMGFLQSPHGISFNLSIPLSPGNNGAAVFNSEGELLGIIGGLVRRSGFSGEMSAWSSNFAEVIKSNYILNTAKQIGEMGTVKRAWIGLMLRDAPGNMGVIIERVVENSPGERAGLKNNDLIIAMNGNNIRDMERFKELLFSHEPGEKVVLSVIRRKRELEIPVKLTEGNNNGGPGEYEDFSIEKITPGKFKETRGISTEEEIIRKMIELSSEIERLKKEIKRLK